MKALKEQKLMDRFSGVTTRWFEILILIIFTYGANTLGKIQDNISSLNTSMVVIVEKITTQQKTIDDHETRIRQFEKR